MNTLIVASCLLAVATATPGYFGAVPLTYSAVPLTYSSYVGAPASVSTQHHAQDILGQYSYGYSNPNSAKQEVRTADGVTRGGYSYVDSHGLVQSASYVSDPAHGFRVAATNLPVGHSTAVVAAAPVVAGPAETPEVVAAKAAHFQAHAVAKANVLGRKKRSPGVLAVPSVVSSYIAAPFNTYGYSSVAAHGAQIIAATPYSTHPGVVSTYAAAPASVSTQHHIQDTLGQYSYGYSNPNSAKQEVRTADGVTRGGYSYLDGHGLVQSANYVSDGLGFRVAATNLPVGPA